jgi:hypothetical protein
MPIVLVVLVVVFVVVAVLLSHERRAPAVGSLLAECVGTAEVCENFVSKLRRLLTKWRISSPERRADDRRNGLRGGTPCSA